MSSEDLLQVMRHFEKIATKGDFIGREDFASGLALLGYERASSNRLFELAGLYQGMLKELSAV